MSDALFLYWCQEKAPSENCVADFHAERGRQPSYSVQAAGAGGVCPHRFSPVEVELPAPDVLAAMAGFPHLSLMFRTLSVYRALCWNAAARTLTEPCGRESVVLPVR